MYNIFTIKRHNLKDIITTKDNKYRDRNQNKTYITIYNYLKET